MANMTFKTNLLPNSSTTAAEYSLGSSEKIWYIYGQAQVLNDSGGNSGIAGQVLKKNDNNEIQWTTLGGASTRGVYAKGSAAAIPSTDTNLITTQTVYFGLPTINDVHNYTSNTKYYVPTTKGTTGQFLMSQGTATPSWSNLPSATTAIAGIVQLSTATNSSATNLAATPSAVQAAYGRANDAYTLASGKTSNTGTVTKVSTGVGLTGGDITGTGTVKAKLKTETAFTADSAAQTNTANRQYMVGVDKSGYLSVNVPWTDTTYSLSGLGGVGTVSASGTAPLTLSASKSGTTVSITGSVAAATTAAAGITQYTAANLNTWLNQLTTGSSDPTDADWYISQYAGGGTATTSFHRRPVSALYNYIKTKLAVTNNNINLSRNTETTIATIGGTAIKIKLPASDNTDTKVTAVGNHYTPAADTSAALSADASSTTAATWNSTSLVTGVNIQRDAKGHVTGVTVDSIKMPANPNTNTWRPIQVNGTAALSDSTTTLNLKAGSNVSIANSSGTVTITATNTTYSAATTSTAGLMSAADKTKLDGIAAGANNYTYTLPIASSSTLGGIKVGTGLGISSGTLSVSTTSGTSTLAWNSEVTLGTIGGLAIKAKLPTNPNSDTKNTAGSTDISTKIFLVGAASQTASAQTYSDNQVYVTNGQLDANVMRVAEHVKLQYNTTTNALDFVFV